MFMVLKSEQWKLDTATTFYRAAYIGQLSTNEIDQTDEPTTTKSITSTTTITTATANQSSTSTATEPKSKITEAKQKQVPPKTETQNNKAKNTGPA